MVALSADLPVAALQPPQLILPVLHHQGAVQRQRVAVAAVACGGPGGERLHDDPGAGEAGVAAVAAALEEEVVASALDSSSDPSFAPA